MPSQTTNFLRSTKRYLDYNSTSILTGLSLAGVVSTAYFAALGGMDAIRKIEDRDLENSLAFETDLSSWEGDVYVQTWKDKALLTWKCYIPAAVSGVSTLAFIGVGHKISSKRTAALATAYSLTEVAFNEYKAKVVETLGEKKAVDIRDRVAEDRVNRTAKASSEVLVVSDGEVLCFESFTGRYFKSSMEALRKAQNDINSQIINEGYASLNEFFNAVGIPYSGVGEELGWSTDEMLDLQFTSVLNQEGKPCLSVGYSRLPAKNYYKMG